MSRHTVSWSPCGLARLATTNCALARAASEPSATGQQQLQALAALPVRPSQLPVTPERRADPQPDLRLPALRCPGQRSANVGELGVEPLEPTQLLRPEEGRVGLLCERA